MYSMPTTCVTPRGVVWRVHPRWVGERPRLGEFMRRTERLDPKWDADADGVNYGAFSAAANLGAASWLLASLLSFVLLPLTVPLRLVGFFSTVVEARPIGGREVHRWSVRGWSTTRHLVAAVSKRIEAGHPLPRDPERLLR